MSSTGPLQDCSLVDRHPGRRMDPDQTIVGLAAATCSNGLALDRPNKTVAIVRPAQTRLNDARSDTLQAGG